MGHADCGGRVFSELLNSGEEFVEYETLLNEFNDHNLNNFAFERLFVDLIKNDRRLKNSSLNYGSPMPQLSGSGEATHRTEPVQAYYDRIKNHDLLSAEEERELFERREEFKELYRDVVLSLPSSAEAFRSELRAVRDEDRSVKNLLEISKVEKLPSDEEDELFRQLEEVDDRLLNNLRRFRWVTTDESDGKTGDVIHRSRHRILAAFQSLRVDGDLVEKWGEDFRQTKTAEDFGPVHRRALEELLDFLEFARRYYRDCIVVKNLRLVFSLLDQFKNQGLSTGDLIQEGNMGLFKAIEKFDYNKGYKFSTYATWWIRQAMQRAIHDQRSLIRIPSHRREQLTKVFRAISELKQKLHREPDPDEVAEHLNWSTDKVETLLKIEDRPLSLNEDNGDSDDRTLEDVMDDPDAGRYDTRLVEEELERSLEELLGELSWREEQIIRMRFGLDQEKTHTFEKIGSLMDLSKERVRQIEQNALDDLRERLESDPRAELFEELLGV